MRKTAYLLVAIAFCAAVFSSCDKSNEPLAENESEIFLLPKEDAGQVWMGTEFITADTEISEEEIENILQNEYWLEIFPGMTLAIYDDTGKYAYIFGDDEARRNHWIGGSYSVFTTSEALAEKAESLNMSYFKYELNGRELLVNHHDGNPDLMSLDKICWRYEVLGYKYPDLYLKLYISDVTKKSIIEKLDPNIGKLDYETLHWRICWHSVRKR